MAAHEFGGFDESARVLLPHQGTLDYGIGYRHMVSRPRSHQPAVPTAHYRHYTLAPQCHFMSMLWFRALRKYEYAMRVDEDVCILRLPSRELLSTLLDADYTYGLETLESHRKTVETFNPWLAEYIKTAALEPTMPPLPTENIVFTNFFISRID
eukprot:388725-Prymnesium_polylepis.1